MIERLAAGRQATWSCFLMWPRKQIASTKLFSMRQVCWKVLGVVSNRIPWKPLVCWNVWAIRVVQCTKKNIWSLLSSFSRFQNIYLISDSYFKSLASGYLGKCRTPLNTICLVVCEDIIVRTPSSAHDSARMWFVWVGIGCIIQKEGENESTGRYAAARDRCSIGIAVPELLIYVEPPKNATVADRTALIGIFCP